MKKQVSILGCGWLGLPLARYLVHNGWEVKGSTTSVEKISSLENEGIVPFKIKLLQDQVDGDIQEFLSSSELLIINIPPGLKKDPGSSFVSKLKQLTKAVSKSAIKQIIYVSSTGVFQDHESIPTFTEHYKFTPKEVEESQLAQAENLILNLEQVQTSVIRFGGLIGKGRHPVNYLSGKTGLKNPEAPVNLIHLDNCLLLISEIIIQNKFGMVFHGVEDILLSKEEYYTQKAKELGLTKPEFVHEEKSVGKNISMKRTAKVLSLKLENKV